jgi:uncharacterized membrane protein HdeD (DUF308 family)
VSISDDVVSVDEAVLSVESVEVEVEVEIMSGVVEVEVEIMSGVVVLISGVVVVSNVEESVLISGVIVVVSGVEESVSEFEVISEFEVVSESGVVSITAAERLSSEIVSISCVMSALDTPQTTVPVMTITTKTLTNSTYHKRG